MNPDFETFLTGHWVRRGRAVCFTGIAFTLLLVFYDLGLHPEAAGRTIPIKLATALVLSLLAWATYQDWVRRIIRGLAPLSACAFIAAIDWSFHVQGVQDKADRVFAFTASTFVIFYLLPMRAREGLAYLATAYVSCFLFGSLYGYPAVSTFALPYLAQAAVIVAVGIIGNRVYLATKKSEIEKTAALEARTEQLAEAKIELEAALSELKASQQALARTEGLAAVSELVNGISHEINNPLASAYSLLESLAEDMESGAPASEMAESLEMALGQLGRTRALIEELKSLASEVHLAPASVDLRMLLRDVIQKLEAAKKSGLFAFEEPQRGLSVKATYAQLSRVFHSLFENAVEAEERAGKAPRVRVRVENASPKVRIVIEDHGVGISPDIREKIFQPFFTTRRDQHRTGLGLYLAHEIVRSLGGSISVSSELNQGSRFSVELPVAEQAA